MKIKLLSLQLLNFKGCKNLTIKLGQQTDILGANATGKTRIFDAFTWLFFGKDSEDRKDFNIKTLDSTGEPIHRQDSAVSAKLDIDGIHKTFQRLYSEKWQKRRGEGQLEFTGHETSYYIDGVPLLQKEYMKAVDALISEDLFKLLTNPFHFPSMGWESRRTILERMANIQEDMIYESQEDFKRLLAAMEGRPLVAFLKMLSEKKKNIKADLLQIPARIDEAQRSIPAATDWAKIKEEIDILEEEHSGISKQIQSKTARYESRHKEILEKQKLINDKKLQLQKLEAAQTQQSKKKLLDIEGEVDLLKMAIKNHESIMNSNRGALLQRQKLIEDLAKEITELRAKWDEVDKLDLKYHEDDRLCPTCKQELPAEEIMKKQAAMKILFNEEKLKRLAEIEDLGKDLAKRKTAHEKEVKDLEKQIDVSENVIKQSEEKQKDLDKQKLAAPQILGDTEEIIKLKAEIRATEGSNEEAEPANTKDLKDQLSQIKIKLDGLKTEYSKKEDEGKVRLRISELKGQESGLSQQLADLEGLEFIADNFEKEKISQVEQQINSRFKIVRFKMFNQLINGGTEPACEILIGGVPFPDANNAAKINAGIDIINALSEYYQISAPIFVDNAEAVNTLLPTGSQLIRLVVTEDSELIIKQILL